MVDRLTIREGRADDGAAILGLWDRAIAWLVERGQPGQWGPEPASERPGARELVDRWVASPGLRVAEIGGLAVGVSVTAAEPPGHVPPTSLRETYLHFLISDRARAGQGIGSELVQRASSEARAAGAEVLRVDCWAGAPYLVAWYERQGFVRSDTFTVNVRGDWHGQVFEMRL